MILLCDRIRRRCAASLVGGNSLGSGDCVDHLGDDLPHAPRSMLKWQLARALDAGYRVKMGSELEF